MTSDAQTIPEDVMKAVQSVWEKAWSKAGSTNAESIRDAIAFGILEERERCARIAAQTDLPIGRGFWASEEVEEFAVSLRSAVATSIRNPSPTIQPSPPTSDDDLAF
jgi:hypothetical protein